MDFVLNGASEWVEESSARDQPSSTLTVEGNGLATSEDRCFLRKLGVISLLGQISIQVP